MNVILVEGYCTCGASLKEHEMNVDGDIEITFEPCKDCLLTAAIKERARVIEIVNRVVTGTMSGIPALIREIESPTEAK